ncbi:MAG: efflux RND transporter periplasmic adaptor subunit [Betaproteobacteria bacterium]|nr:efflux RND transporter periplasmic adaptor subunit [Betaproteobacteria bacterium]
MSRRNVIVAVVMAAVLAGGAAAYGWWNSRATAPGYRFATIERGGITAAVSATGTLNPVVSVQVGSQVSGQIKEINVDFNSAVKKGQMIARIDPDSFALRVNQAMADLEAARATVLTQHANVAALRAEVSRARVNLAEAEREFQRNKTLFEKEFVSAAVRDRAQAGFESAQEQVKTAQAQMAVGEAQVRNVEALVKQREAQLAQARVDLERTAIRAPVDGIVVKRSVEPGQTVAASLQAPELFIIAQDLREMQVETSIDEAEVGRIRVGQNATFTVDSFPGRAFSGKVTQVRKAAQVVQNVVTYTAVVTTANPDLTLFPGMTANVRIVVDTREGALKVPNAALRFRPAGAADAPKGEAKGEEGAGARQQANRERLTRELNLTPDQQARLEVIFSEMRQKIDALQEQKGEARRRQLERFRAEARGKIAEMLNPEQRARYQEIVAEQTGRGGSRGRVWVLDGAGGPKAVTVRLGLNDGSFTELVSSELAEGAQVIVGTTELAKARTTPTGAPRLPF